MTELSYFTKEEKNAIINNPIPMIIYQYSDKLLTPLFFSRGALSFFKMNKEDLLDYVLNNWATLIHPDDATKIQIFKNELFHNIPTNIDLNYRLLLPKDPKYTWVKVSGTFEQASDKTYLGYFSYCDTTSIHKNKEKDQSILDSNDTEINPIYKKSIKSIFDESLKKSHIFYGIYDVDSKKIIDGNIYDYILKNATKCLNFPDSSLDMKIYPEKDRKRYLSMMKKILNGSNNEEGTIRIFDSYAKKNFNIKLKMNAVYDSEHQLKYILGFSESLKTFNEMYNMGQDILSKIGFIIWNYLIEDGSYNMDVQKYEKNGLLNNANLLFSSIKNKEIKIPLAMIKGQQKTAYNIVNLKNETDKINKFEINYTLIKNQDQKPVSILGVARDITKYYEMEENYIKKLEKANVAKASFLAKLSHDMRTPLGAIISLSEFGLDECHDKNSLEYFKKIKDNSVYLLSFISEVLEAKRNTNDNLEINKNVFKSCDVLNQILSIVQQRAIEKSITFNPHFISKDKGVYLYANEKKFKQIVINLLNNAIKYTPKGGKVEFEVNAKIKDNKLVSTIIVSDNGVGMSKEFQDQMFDEYTQEHNKLSFEEEGSGLGLSIVKKNIDLLSGSICCVSELNKGTTFTINLILDIATQQQINSLNDSFNKEKLELLKGKKILLCEDKEINIMIIKKILYSIGVIVDIAENGVEGIRSAKNNYYDLVLMDIRMPVMDGLSATIEIRKFNKDLPIVALSSNANPQDIEDSLNSGMNNHLSKPIDKQKLFETLIKYI